MKDVKWTKKTKICNICELMSPSPIAALSYYTKRLVPTNNNDDDIIATFMLIICAIWWSSCVWIDGMQSDGKIKCESWRIMDFFYRLMLTLYFSCVASRLLRAFFRSGTVWSFDCHLINSTESIFQATDPGKYQKYKLNCLLKKRTIRF